MARKAWGGRYAQRIRAAVFASKGRECLLQLPGCTGTATSVHHIIPRSKGGPDTLVNLIPACMPCNRRQGDQVTVAGRPPERADVTTWFTDK